MVIVLMAAERSFQEVDCERGRRCVAYERREWLPAPPRRVKRGVGRAHPPPPRSRPFERQPSPGEIREHPSSNQLAQVSSPCFRNSCWASSISFVSWVILPCTFTL